jgi:MYXO-CTERM domain-containing protein
MRTHSRLLSAVLATSAVCQSLSADAIVVARVTRRGYIVVDDVGDYNDQIPVANTRDTAAFISDLTSVLSEVEGFHEGRFLATMQIPSSQTPLAFYLPIRNEVRGLGQRSTLDGRSEVFDTNSVFGTAFPLDGFVYLNSYRFYTDPRAVIFGRFLICTQEFGHRYGVQLGVPAFPTGTVDGGVTDGGALDAAVSDAAAADVVTADVAGDVSDVGIAPLARDSLLGRGNQNGAGMVTNRSHWSYFFNSGGSPMEGNAWTEYAPGMFRTERPTFRFSPIDLYTMGLIPASEVPTTFLIADPQNVPRNVTRDSAPEYYNRQVMIRGRRVDVSVADLVRANGPRVPAYPTAERDLDVVWVLLAPADAVNDELAAEFDEAVDSCAMGYAFATAERGRLVTTVPGSDAGVTEAGVTDASGEVPVDASVRPDVDLGDVPNITPPDGMTVPVMPSEPLRAAGGCQCDVSRTVSTTNAQWALVAMAAVAVSRRRRRTRA